MENAMQKYFVDIVNTTAEILKFDSSLKPAEENCPFGKETADCLQFFLKLAEDMGFVSPFKKAKTSSNPLSKMANDYIAAGKAPVAWVFTTMPSEDWKNGVGAAMVAYAQGKGDWKAVENAFINGWKTEYDKANGKG